MLTAQKRHSDLAHSIFMGIGWLIAQSFGARLIGLASQIVLARVLLPGDFGILALAGTVTSVLGALVNFGIDDVLLQRQHTMHYWRTPAFLTSLGLGTATMLLIIAASPFIAELYRTPELTSVLMIMAIGMPIGALCTVPTAHFRAAFKFRLLAAYGTVDLIAGQVFTIVLALQGFGVYSFVIPGPILGLIRAAIFWSMAKPKLGRMRRRQLMMMSAKGATIFGTKIITAAVSQGDYFVLGLLAPAPVVGAYFFAFRLAIQPVQMLAGALQNVLFPALAQLRTDPARQREAALNASRILAFAVMPYCFMQAAMAAPLLSLVFGAKWQAAVPLVQILSVGLAFDAVSWVAGALLNARGEFRRSFIYGCVFSPFFFVAVAVGGLYASAHGVAIGVSLFYLVISPVYSYCVFSRLGVSFRNVAEIYLSSALFAAIAMTIAAFAAAAISSGDLMQVVLIVCFGGGLYLPLIRLFAPATYHQLVSRLKGVLWAKRSTSA